MSFSWLAMAAADSNRSAGFSMSPFWRSALMRSTSYSQPRGPVSPCTWGSAWRAMSCSKKFSG